MCARITQRYESEEIARAIGLPFDEERAFRQEEWNGAPGVGYRIIELAQGGGALHVELRHWGLVPRWARDDSFAAINARAETADTKPSFREAFRSGRGLLPVSGWYEWQGQRRPKQPYHVRSAAGGVLLLAVLCEPARPGGRYGKTFSVVTTTPQPAIASVHDRQPAIIDADDAAAWLDRSTSTAVVSRLARGTGSGALEAQAVSRRVNRPGQGGAELIEATRLGPQAEPGLPQRRPRPLLDGTMTTDT